MTGQLQFSPIFPRHAIERCAASVAFVPGMPDKAFEKIVASVTPKLTAQGFIAQQTVAIGFRLGPGGAMESVQPPGGGPRVFTFPDQTTALTIGADNLTFTNSSYVRWQPFVGSVEKHVLPILGLFLETVSIAAVKLEYWDRFVWGGSWDDFDVGKLLRPGTSYVSKEAASRPKQWHSHSGWFDKEGELRRLTNVHVDIAEIVMDPAAGGLPSVGIYSALTDQTNVPEYGKLDISALENAFVIDRLEAQHLALKGILGHIITDEMANRIGLNPRESKNAGA